MKRRMRHEQFLHAAADAAGDAKRGELVRQMRLARRRLQTLQRRNHVTAPGQLRAAGVSAELAPAAEPHDDDGGQHRENDFRDDGRNPKRGPMAVAGFEHHAVDKVTDDARGK